MTTAAEQALQRVLDERTRTWEQTGKPLAEIAQTRDFTPEEAQDWERANADFTKYGQRIEALRADLAAETQVRAFTNGGAGPTPTEWRNLDTGERAAVSRDASIQTHPVFARATAADRSAAEANYGSLGAMIRALATGGTGSALIPTSWAGGLIDLARSESAIVKAQAPIIPMEAGVIKLGRQTGDPSAAFRAEASAITASDPTFDSVTLTAKTMSALVISSREWWQDADNADQLVVNALAQAIAGQLDLVALYGGITTGAGTINLPTPDPNPRGILAALNALRAANVLGGSAADGTTPTIAAGYWNEVIDALYTVRDGNEDPTGIIWSSKLARQYARAVDTTGQPLAIPAAVAEVPRFMVNRIPSYTKGENTTATDLFVGDFRQLLIGQRLAFEIRPLPELYAGTGQYGVVASWRGDIALARPSAFSVYRSLKGAA